MTGFDDLDSTEAVGGPDEEETVGGDGSSSTDNDDIISTASDTTQRDSDGSDASRTLDTPAFPFDETSQEQIYPRETTYEEFRRYVDYELKRELDEDSVPDVSGRELDDALLRLAMAHPEQYKELVKDARR